MTTTETTYRHGAKVQNGLQEMHLNSLLESVSAKMGLNLISWKKFELGAVETVSSSTIANSAQTTGSILGHIGFEMKGSFKGKGDCSKEEVVKVVLRSKMKGDAWKEAASQLGLSCSKEEGEAIRQAFVFVQNTHLRDMEFARGALDGAWFSAFMPEVYFVASKQDVEDERIFFFMENLECERFSHLNVLEGGIGTDTWTSNDIKTVLSGIAHFHAYYMGNTELIGGGLNNKLLEGLVCLSEAGPYMKVATHSNMEQLPEIWRKEESLNLLKYIAKPKEIINTLESFPKTVCHNDFNPRNVCLRRDPKPYQQRLCVYDWELANIHVPQHDLAEFLVFVLPETASVTDMNDSVEFYRQELLVWLKSLGRCQNIIDMIENKFNFDCVFIYEVIEFIALRFNLYFTTARGMGQMAPFLPRVAQNGLKYLHAMKNSKCLLRLTD